MVLRPRGAFNPAFRGRGERGGFRGRMDGRGPPRGGRGFPDGGRGEGGRSAWIQTRPVQAQQVQVQV